MKRIKKNNMNAIPNLQTAGSRGFTRTPFVALCRRRFSYSVQRNSISRLYEYFNVWRGIMKTMPRKVSGFTLVETLIAITVLLTAVAGPLTIASRGLISAHFARDQVTAFYLAQEATELIRNKRDNNALASVSWLSGLEECIGQSCLVNGTSDIDDPNTIETCSVSCPVLREDAVSGLYGYDPSWDASRFIRTVRVTEINPTEANISVTISWSTGPLAKSFTINENILDWQ